MSLKLKTKFTIANMYLEEEEENKNQTSQGTKYSTTVRSFFGKAKQNRKEKSFYLTWQKQIKKI